MASMVPDLGTGMVADKVAGMVADKVAGMVADMAANNIFFFFSWLTCCCTWGPTKRYPSWPTWWLVTGAG